MTNLRLGMVLTFVAGATIVGDFYLAHVRYFVFKQLDRITVLHFEFRFGCHICAQQLVDQHWRAT